MGVPRNTAIAAVMGLWALSGAACDQPVVTPPEQVAAPPSFLIGGAHDVAHPNVGVLVTFHPFIPGNPLAPLCSGTLIAENVVVTAGHCAFFVAAAGLAAWFSFDPQFDESSPLIAVTAIPHPGFEPTANPLDVSGIGGDPYELGVLLLEEPATGITPASLPGAGLLDRLKSEKLLHPGDLFTVVGYGALGFEDGFPILDGSRRSADTHYRSLNGEAVTLGSTDAHVCFGDSGGPNFLEVDGASLLTSVTWWLGSGPLSPRAVALNCRSVWYRAYRLDTPQARSFLGEYVTLP